MSQLKCDNVRAGQLPAMINEKVTGFGIKVGLVVITVMLVETSWSIARYNQ